MLVTASLPLAHRCQFLCNIRLHCFTVPLSEDASPLYSLPVFIIGDVLRQSTLAAFFNKVGVPAPLLLRTIPVEFSVFFPFTVSATSGFGGIRSLGQVRGTIARQVDNIFRKNSKKTLDQSFCGLFYAWRTTVPTAGCAKSNPGRPCRGANALATAGS